MKKLLTICLLVVTLLVGGMTVDAKTTKKKSSKSSSSASWNDDIPSATLIINNGPESQFLNHGYYYDDSGYTKPGVCEFHHMGTSGGWVISIEIPNSSKRSWLYNNIKSYIRNSKDKGIRKSKVTLDSTGIIWGIN